MLQSELWTTETLLRLNLAKEAANRVFVVYG